MIRIRTRMLGVPLLLVFLLTALLVAACTSTAPTSPAPAAKQAESQAIALKTYSAWPKDNKENKALWMLEEELKRRGSKITFNYVGGPEAFPVFESLDAISKGAIDIAITASSYNTAQAPAALAHKLTPYSPWEDREKGVYDLMKEVYQKVNVMYLGRATDKEFRLYTNKEVKSSADFKGLRIRVTPAYKDFVQALGSQPVTTAPGEVYTALERNVVDGYGWPRIWITDFGWQEITKYAVMPTFFKVDSFLAMNLDAWNKLPKAEQDLLMEAVKKTERDVAAYVNQETEKEEKLLQDKGIKIVTLSDANAYRQLAYDATWKVVLAQAPDMGPKLKEAMTKK